MASEPKDYYYFYMNDFDFQFLNFAYKVKEFQCHSNNSLQLLELKEKNNNKTIHVI